MKMYFVCFLLAIVSSLSAQFSLKERIEKATAHDYMVTESNKMITLICLRSLNPDTLILEEISAPSQNLSPPPTCWKEWVKQKAPGHTSWSMVEIDMATGQILECYSFSRSSWLRLSQKESLLATLFNLPLKKVPLEKQKKIGPPPNSQEPDFRKTWTPPLTFEGKKITNAKFDVYETIWPEDDTELSNQDLTLYFDRTQKCPLPFWIQVKTPHATAALRTIDAGKNLPMVHPKMPRRTPEFLGLPLKTDRTLQLNIKSPNYYKEFELYAIDLSSKEKQIFPITHTLIQKEGEFKIVEIDFEDLNQTLQPECRYTWLLVPTGHPEAYTQSTKSFDWNHKSSK